MLIIHTRSRVWALGAPQANKIQYEKFKISRFFWDFFNIFLIFFKIFMCVRLFDPLFNQLAGGWHRIRPGRNYVLCTPRKGLEHQNPSRLLQIRILALDRQANIAGFGSKMVADTQEYTMVYFADFEKAPAARKSSCYRKDRCCFRNSLVLVQ